MSWKRAPFFETLRSNGPEIHLLKYSGLMNVPSRVKTKSSGFRSIAISKERSSFPRHAPFLRFNADRPRRKPEVHPGSARACKHHHYLRHLWSPDQQVEAGSGSALGKSVFGPNVR